MAQQGLRAFIGGVDYSSKVEQSTLSIDKQLMHKGDTCRFNLFDFTRALPQFDSFSALVLQDQAGNVRFNGLLAVDRTSTPDAASNVHQISGQDATWFLNMRLANKKYSSTSIDAIARDLIASYVPELTTAGVQVGLPGVPTFSASHLKISDALDKLVRLGSTGAFLMWDVSPTNDLQFFDSNNVPSSGVTLVDTPDNGTTTVAYQRDSFWYESDVTQIANTITVRGGTFVSNTHVQTWGADGVTTGFSFDYVPDTDPNNKGFVPNVTVAGVAQSVAIDNSTGFGSNQVLIATSSDGQSASLTFATAPASGATVQAVYVYDVPIFIKLTDPTSVASFGTWESYVTDTTLVSQPAAARRAFGELSQFSKPVHRAEVHLRKDYIGPLDVGQTVGLVNSQIGLNTTMIVAGYNMKGLGGGYFDTRLNLVSVG